MSDGVTGQMSGTGGGGDAPALVIYAVDLSRDGIGLYDSRAGSAWRHLDSVPLQVGTLARNLARLHARTGVAPDEESEVDVWLPVSEIEVQAVDLSDPDLIRDRIAAIFSATSQYPVEDLIFDTGPTLDNGLTPVAAIPRQVLEETEAFLGAHGFGIRHYRTTEIPEGFNQEPVFDGPRAPGGMVRPPDEPKVEAFAANALGWLLPGGMIAAAALLIGLGVSVMPGLLTEPDVRGLPGEDRQAVAGLPEVGEPVIDQAFGLPRREIAAEILTSAPPGPEVAPIAFGLPSVAPAGDPARVQTDVLATAVQAPALVETTIPNLRAPDSGAAPSLPAIADDAARLARFDGTAQTFVSASAAPPDPVIDVIAYTDLQDGLPVRSLLEQRVPSRRDLAFDIGRFESGAVMEVTSSAELTPPAPAPVRIAPQIDAAPARVAVSERRPSARDTAFRLNRFEGFAATQVAVLPRFELSTEQTIRVAAVPDAALSRADLASRTLLRRDAAFGLERFEGALSARVATLVTPPLDEETSGPRTARDRAPMKDSPGRMVTGETGLNAPSVQPAGAIAALGAAEIVDDPAASDITVPVAQDEPAAGPVQPLGLAAAPLPEEPDAPEAITSAGERPTLAAVQPLAVDPVTEAGVAAPTASTVPLAVAQPEVLPALADTTPAAPPSAEQTANPPDFREGRVTENRVRIIGVRPNVLPPARPLPEGTEVAALPEDATAPDDTAVLEEAATQDAEAAENAAQAGAGPAAGASLAALDRVTPNRVRVTSSRPGVVPPPRPDDVLVAVIAPSAEQVAAAEAALKAEQEGDLAPSATSLGRAASPRGRPESIVAAARAEEERLLDQSPTDFALTASLSPPARPGDLRVITPPRRTVAVAATAPRAPATPREVNPPAPQLPTVASVARAATIENVLPTRELSLIGVYGTSSQRHALVRLPGGRMVKVRPGDTVRGYQVTAISADAISLRRRGRDSTLVIPR